MKNERLSESVQPAAKTEMGCEVKIVDRLGAFEHFYETSEVEGVGSKHYVANAFVVEPVERVEVTDDHTPESNRLGHRSGNCTPMWNDI